MEAIPWDIEHREAIPIRATWCIRICCAKSCTARSGTSSCKVPNISLVASISPLLLRFSRFACAAYGAAFVEAMEGFTVKGALKSYSSLIRRGELRSAEDNLNAFVKHSRLDSVESIKHSQWSTKQTGGVNIPAHLISVDSAR